MLLRFCQNICWLCNEEPLVTIWDLDWRLVISSFTRLLYLLYLFETYCKWVTGFFQNVDRWSLTISKPNEWPPTYVLYFRHKICSAVSSTYHPGVRLFVLSLLFCACCLVNANPLLPLGFDRSSDTNSTENVRNNFCLQVLFSSEHCSKAEYICNILRFHVGLRVVPKPKQTKTCVIHFPVRS